MARIVTQSGGVQAPSGRADVVHLKRERQARIIKAYRLADGAEVWMEAAVEFLYGAEQAAAWRTLPRGRRLRDLVVALVRADNAVWERVRVVAEVLPASDGSGAVSESTRFEVLRILGERAKLADKLDTTVAAYYES